MENYSEESLDKLLKKRYHKYCTITSITEMQSNIKTLEEVRKLNDKFTNLESQLLVKKNVNSLLQQRVIDFERQYWENSKYSRRDWLEVPGIPESFKQNELDDKVLRFFKKSGCDIPSDNIEACYCVVIKFLKRKDCQQIFSGKKRPEQTEYEGVRPS